MADADRVAILLPAKTDDDGADVREFGLGSVLIWGRRESLPIVVVAPADRAGLLTRQAVAFEQLSVVVLDGTSLADVDSAELPKVPELGAEALARTELFESVGAVPIDDFGRLVAEVQGLEIARADGGDDCCRRHEAAG